MEKANTETMPSEFSDKVRLRQELLFWITAGVLLFIFSDTSNLRNTEAFRAETFREMLLTERWFQPVFNWKNIYDHSFLSYWLAAPFVKLFGFTEFAFRLPGVLGALAALYGMRLAGRELFTEKTAFLGSWMLLGSVGFLLWGRSGSDGIIGMAAAICSIGWYFRSEEKRGFFTWMIFYLISLTGVFCSTPAALIVPAAVVLPLSMSESGRKKGDWWKNGAAFCLTLMIFLSVLHMPLVLSSVSGRGSGGSVWLTFFLQPWFREMGAQIQRLEWSGFAVNCLLELPRLLLPWSPLLLMGIGWLLKNWNGLSCKVKVTLAGSAAAVVLCSLMDPEKSLLAAAPLVLLLGCGGIAGSGEEKWKNTAVSGVYYMMLVASSVAVCSIVIYPLWDKLTTCVPSATLVLWPVAAGGAAWFALFLDYRKNNVLTVWTGLPFRLGSSVLAGTLLMGCCMSVLQPVSHAEFGCDKKFFRELHSVALRELHDYSTERIIFYCTRVPGGFLFYNRLVSPVTGAGNVGETVSRFAGSRVIFAVREEREIQEKFMKECKALNIDPKAVTLNFSRSLFCGGEEHYSVFTAELPQKRVKTVPDKESVQ